MREKDIHRTIIDMSYMWFSGNVTKDDIRDFIRRMKMTFPDENLDEARLFRELEEINSVSIGSMKSLDDIEGHLEWFNPSTGEGLKRKMDWHFWDHYSKYLAKEKRWSSNLIANIDSQSNQILSRLEDPSREGPWDRRGMVMGSVQSGKTANYTALMTKAADAGYKLFIVLAGIHDSLRSQTQLRINEEFLGYDLERVQKLTGGERRIGVRTMFRDHNSVYTLTSSSQKGDFSKLIASQSGIHPDKNGVPIVLIIKKNVSILKNLISWVPSIIGQAEPDGSSKIKDIPLLVIDDECDYASINTKEPERDEMGNIVEDWDPTKTNLMIRKLLNLFEKSAYVGYTATPYANIFIHHSDPHPKYGEDLFPKSFIISLPQPSNYLGPEKVFGMEGDGTGNISSIEPLPLIRHLNDYGRAIPEGHRIDLHVDSLPQSLKDAIKYFVIGCAVRNIRQIGTPHNTMLIHITRFTGVQAQIRTLVERELNQLVARIMSNDPLQDLVDIWEKDYVPTSANMMKRGFREPALPSWKAVESSLGTVVRNIAVRSINGTVRDALEYKNAEDDATRRIHEGENVPWNERGISIIAIGGDKLSRGLTLEGLTISYYLRASTFYDTLMQMGRWFGYRDGYTDLCRIFTTEMLVSYYRHIALATRELRGEVEFMSELKLTPLEFGLKIRSAPGRLMVTSMGKSRTKQKVSISYSGQRPMTILFDPRQSQNNLNALAALIKDIGRGPDRRHNETYHWSNVPSTYILRFLSSYKMPELTKIVADPRPVAKYIERQNALGELVRWEVLMISKEGSLSSRSDEDSTHEVIIGGYPITMVRRKAHYIGKERISIGTLINPSDEELDLTEEERKRAILHDREHRGKPDLPDDGLPSGESIRLARSKHRGLLLIYLASGDGPNEVGETVQYGMPGEEIVAYAISFPRSDTAEPIEYWTTPVYQSEDSHYT